MFDRDQALKEWRRKLASCGITNGIVLDELESHLLADMDVEVARGCSEQKAFDLGVTRLGRTDFLVEEFGKIPGAGRERMRSAFLTFAGISNSLQAHPMNAMISLLSSEPRWATYSKAAVFLAPAMILWTLSVIFLVPKLQLICREAGVTMPSVFEVTNLIADHTLLICLIPILLLALLERWSARWPNYRRIAMGTMVFVFNAAVLALITLMVVVALVAAPHLMHQA